MLTQWPIQSKTIMKFQSISILSTNQSLCKSQKLKFDILKRIILKRFNIFCFNNMNWIDIIWNGEVEKHKINIIVVISDQTLNSSRVQSESSSEFIFEK